MANETIKHQLSALKLKFGVKTDEQLAECLGISPYAVREWSKRKVIPSKYKLMLTQDYIIDNSYEIDYYEDILVSAGMGRINRECKPERIRIPKRLVGFVNAKNVHAVRVLGDSMSPTIEEGDVVFVDTSDTNIISGKIYIVVIGDEAYVKRLFKAPRQGRVT
jgi:phage repressor protein C with HTH and peptisase S24 domain